MREYREVRGSSLPKAKDPLFTSCFGLIRSIENIPQCFGNFKIEVPMQDVVKIRAALEEVRTSLLLASKRTDSQE